MLLDPMQAALVYLMGIEDARFSLGTHAQIQLCKHAFLAVLFPDPPNRDDRTGQESIESTAVPIAGWNLPSKCVPYNL